MHLLRILPLLVSTTTAFHLRFYDQMKNELTPWITNELPGHKITQQTTPIKLADYTRNALLLFADPRIEQECIGGLLLQADPEHPSYDEKEDAVFVRINGRWAGLHVVDSVDMERYNTVMVVYAHTEDRYWMDEGFVSPVTLEEKGVREVMARHGTVFEHGLIRNNLLGRKFLDVHTSQAAVDENEIESEEEEEEEGEEEVEVVVEDESLHEMSLS